MILKLLGSQPEYFREGTIIESPTAQLERETQRLHREWLEDPENDSKKAAFAGRLRLLGQQTGNRGMIHHAEELDQQIAVTDAEEDR